MNTSFHESEVNLLYINLPLGRRLTVLIITITITVRSLLTSKEVEEYHKDQKLHICKREYQKDFELRRKKIRIVMFLEY